MNETDEANLSSLLEKPERNVSILMKDSDLNPAVKWDFKGALVESESWSSSIGSNKSVDLTLTAQIGGPEDIQDGVFMSGVNAEHLFV
jgi:hypothetical protein